jgi:hypothetical protein
LVDQRDGDAVFDHSTPLPHPPATFPRLWKR